MTITKTPAEATVLGAYPGLEPADLDRIVSYARLVGRQCRFARLSGGESPPARVIYESDPGSAVVSLAAALFKSRHATATDVAALAYGRDCSAASRALHVLYDGAGPEDTDAAVAATKNAASDAALAQLDALGSVV